MPLNQLKILSLSKAKKNLGWEPKTNFSEGINKTVNWYLKNADWVKKMKERLN